ncbi:protein kinase [Actinoplanes sp. NPDC023714]|uniref:protein kinase domain-containing protein n=1 Tax=Actinoplanes sp. NPDC023714 TaxID=3154322 RepID=UPI0033CAFB37
MPQPGELLGDRYRLDDRLAAGGMGEVWRATDTVLGRPVAVKTLLAGYAGDSGFRTRFQHEARAMASLRHAGVVPVYDFGDAGDDGAYLVMARVDGLPLDKRIAERGSLGPAETMSIVAQAARALAAAHEAGIVHRDVKPGNLIIEPDGTVVLVDFGVARSAQSVTLTGAREVVGTALYIAPEQVSKQATGPSADIYALGAVAYHCLAGRPPFTGDNPLAVALQHVSEEPPPLPAGVPAPVRELVLRALAKDPEARFPSAAAMADAASALQDADAASALQDTDTAILAGAGVATVATPRPPLADTAVGPLLPSPGVTEESAPAKRRNLVVLSALLAAVLGGGVLIAVTDPFGLFSGEPPVVTTPAELQPSTAPSPSTKDDDDAGGSGKINPTSGNDQKRSPSPRTSAPAAPATTDPGPTATTTTTAPETEAPTTATTTAPEPTATTTTAPEEEDQGGGENEQEPEEETGNTES